MLAAKLSPDPKLPGATPGFSTALATLIPTPPQSTASLSPFFALAPFIGG